MTPLDLLVLIMSVTAFIGLVGALLCGLELLWKLAARTLNRLDFDRSMARFRTN